MTPIEAVTKLETLLSGIAPVIVGMDIDSYPANAAVPVIFLKPETIRQVDRSDRAVKNEIDITVEYITNEREPTNQVLAAWADITSSIAVTIRKLQITAQDAQINYRVAGGMFSTLSISVKLGFVNNFADSSEVM